MFTYPSWYRALLAVGAFSLAACGGEDVPPADVAVRSDTARIAEAFVSTFKEADNIDSPAIYHGPGGEHWVIATAKATHQLVVFDAVTGAELRRVGSEGVADGLLSRPNGILVLGDSVLLVVERDNRRVQGFRLPAFTPMGSFGADELIKPYGLAVVERDGAWRVYVTDNYETPEETVPPLAELGARVKWYTVSVGAGDRLAAVLGGAFGDTTAAGAIQVTESIYADPANDVLLLAEELETDSYLKVYTLDGVFTGKTVGRGDFPQQAEGLALYACADGGGYWIATDQGPTVNTFHLYDRKDFTRLASFAAAVTNTTDGVVLTQRGFGPFPAGAFYMAHGDAAISALSWSDIAAATGLRQDCTR
jgi:3-phytase